jgi:hypothetical protein
MAITVNNAVTVTIPNDQLIFDEHIIATSGLIQSKADVKQIPIARIAPGDGMMPRIGGLFFSSAYLMVNHDKKMFTITPAQSKVAPVTLMAYDTGNDCIGAVEVVTASTTPNGPKESSSSGGDGGSSHGNGNNSGNNSNTAESSSSSGLDGGAIAGIIIGALFGFTLLAGIAFLIWRRKRTSVDLPPSELAALGDAQGPVEKYGYHASEMHADDGHTHRMELMAKDPTVYAHEMSSEEQGPFEVSATVRSAIASRDGIK